MGIKIVEEPDVEVTSVEYDRYVAEWKASCGATTINPVELEAYIRRQKFRRPKVRPVLYG